MSLLIVVLTLVANLLVPWKHVAVGCYTPPPATVLPADQTGWGQMVGFTVYSERFPDTTTAEPDRVYLRYCDGMLDLTDRENIDTFAHELLHVKHPGRPHPWIYAHEHSFGRLVIAETTDVLR